MGWNPFSADDWEDLGGSIGSSFTQFGDLIGGAFSTGFNYVLEGGTIVEGQIGNGALVVIKAAEGSVNYAVDFTKVTANSTQNWVQSASGDVADFSVEAYNEAIQLGLEIWKNLLPFRTPPVLGPPDPIARACAVRMFSASAVGMWERDAVSKHYTMAFDFRMTASLPPLSQTAFSGIYVDSSGQWGFIGVTGTGSTLSFNANLDIEFWMVFGDRNDFQQPCYMPGVTVSITLPSGVSITGGVNILIRSSGSFKGFVFRQGVALLPSQSPVVPDAGPPQTNLNCHALAAKAPAYSAASQVSKNPEIESTLLATAVTNTLPFVRRPTSYFFIQAKHSGKFLEVQNSSTADGAHILQASWTGASSQRFRFENQNDGTFVIVPHCSAGNNKVLDVAGNNGDNGALLTQWGRHMGNNQKFQITASDDGYFCMTPKHSGKTLGVSGISTNDGANIVQWPWHGGGHFQFRFIEVFEQEGWKYCRKCEGLCFVQAGAICPAQGAHDVTGSGAYVLLSTAAEHYGAIFQDHWRWCNKCAVLFYGALPGSKCPQDGGQHDSRGSGNYALSIGLETGMLQGGWCWCLKCQGLFYGGAQNGVCPNGGTHDKSGSGKYRILHR